MFTPGLDLLIVIEELAVNMRLDNIPTREKETLKAVRNRFKPIVHAVNYTPLFGAAAPQLIDPELSLTAGIAAGLMPLNEEFLRLCGEEKYADMFAKAHAATLNLTANKTDHTMWSRVLSKLTDEVTDPRERLDMGAIRSIFALTGMRHKNDIFTASAQTAFSIAVGMICVARKGRIDNVLERVQNAQAKENPGA